MASLAELQDALVNADKAGDVEAARQLADAIVAMQETKDPLKQDFRGLKDLAAGAVRGAGSIGATLLWPWDKAQDIYHGDREKGVSSLITGKEPLSRNQERRRDMTLALQDLGADPESYAFKGGKIGAEIAGTSGVGSVLANLAKAAKAGPALITALQTGGMTTKAAPVTLAQKAADLGIRSIGGAAVGGASAGLVDPEMAGTGALIGGALPPALKAAGALGSATGNAIRNVGQSSSERLMQSAIKPTLKQLQKGEAKTAAQTLLELGINPTKGGARKLQSMIDDINTQIEGELANSTATIDKQAVLGRLNDTRRTFGQQVAPQGDLAAIQKVGDEFVSHPGFPQNDIPVQIAQKMKQGTYRVLKDKYGQIGTAETEAQKALARGLKEEISTAVPAVAGLNAQEQKLITTLKVTERRALIEMNKNPMGLAALAQNPWSWAMFMADKSALFKSLAARLVNNATKPPAAAQNLLSVSPAVEQLGYRVAPLMSDQ